MEADGVESEGVETDGVETDGVTGDEISADEVESVAHRGRTWSPTRTTANRSIGSRGQLLAAEQDGIVARRQLLDLGWTPAQARQNVTSGRWVRVLPGIYATFTGELGQRSRVWAAVLHAGTGATASHDTALWLANAVDQPPNQVHVAVPGDRKVQVPGWIRIHRKRRHEPDRHPAAQPPRTGLETAILDSCDEAHAVGTVFGHVFRSTQRRLTSAARLRSALADRSRHRWRSLLNDVLAEIDDGVTSPLERRYARDVEQRHGLPRGERNRPEIAPTGARCYRDVRYQAQATVVELDGLEAHPADQRFRDLRRDNYAVVHGEAVLRYGWWDVANRTCDVAAQVAAVLQSRGWQGSPVPCGPHCQF